MTDQIGIKYDYPLGFFTAAVYFIGTASIDVYLSFYYNPDITKCNYLRSLCFYVFAIVLKYLVLLVCDVASIYYLPPYIHVLLNVLYPVTYFIVMHLTKQVIMSGRHLKSIFAAAAGSLTLFFYTHMKPKEFWREEVAVGFLRKNSVAINIIVLLIAFCFFLLCLSWYFPKHAKFMVYKKKNHTMRGWLQAFNVLVLSMISTELVILAKVFFTRQTTALAKKDGVMDNAIWYSIVMIGASLKIIYVPLFNFGLKISRDKERFVMSTYAWYAIFCETALMQFFGVMFDSYYFLAMMFFIMTNHLIYTHDKRVVHFRNCCKKEKDEKKRRL